jgi:hypothetical protein
VKAGTGPVVEEAFIFNDKELVLTLSVEQIRNSIIVYSGRVWTLWVSFRRPVSKTISVAVLKALAEQGLVCNK